MARPTSVIPYFPQHLAPARPASRRSHIGLPTDHGWRKACRQADNKVAKIEPKVERLEQRVAKWDAWLDAPERQQQREHEAERLVAETQRRRDASDKARQNAVTLDERIPQVRQVVEDLERLPADERLESTDRDQVATEAHQLATELQAGSESGPEPGGVLSSDKIESFRQQRRPGGEPKGGPEM